MALIFTVTVNLATLSGDIARVNAVFFENSLQMQELVFSVIGIPKGLAS
jgi:hypothetical protein